METKGRLIALDDCIAFYTEEPMLYKQAVALIESLDNELQLRGKGALALGLNPRRGL